jgi:hypothetical protein
VNLSGLIGSMPTITADLVRRAAGSYTNGVYSGGTAATSSIRIIYWPATPREIERLPEGMRTREVIGIASKEVLRAAEHETGTQADIVAIAGRDYEVQRVSSYSTQADICHALAVRAAVTT